MADRIHVIYDRPRDWPAHFVVRGWQSLHPGMLTPEGGAVLFADLRAARSHCQRLGLVCFEKDPASDPVIVEVWAPIGTEWPFGLKELPHA